MPNTPRNLFLGKFSGTSLETVYTPSTGQTLVNLWLIVTNNGSTPNTVTIYHASSEDFKIESKTIQAGKSYAFASLAGVTVNDTQSLKVGGSSGDEIIVDLSGVLNSEN